MKKLAILLAAILPAAAHAQTTHSRWLQTGGNDKLGINVFIDTTTIVRSPDRRVSVWVEYRYATKRTDDRGTNFRTWDVRDIFDCTLHTLWWSAWASRNDDGEVVKSSDDMTTPTDVLPGSVTETIMRMLCP